MTTPTQPKAFNAGPGSFSQPSTSGNPPFCMTSTSWLTLQTYLNNVASLPNTLTALSTSMGSGAPADMSDFQKLVTLYGSMQTQGTDFTQTLYPSIVSLASDIYEYAQNVPQYYAGLQELINQLNVTPAPTGAALTTIQNNMVGVVNQLAENIAPYITKASSISTQLNSFVTNLEGDLTTLGSNSPAPGTGYYQYYNDEYGTTSAAVQNLVSEIAAQTTALHKFQAEYNHDVIVAATSPTYGWIWPFGTIAAGIVAGIYGAKATAALNAMNAATANIQSLNAQEQADMNLMNDLTSVTTAIENLSNELNAAISILEGVEGNWTAISSDLTSLSDYLTKDFQGSLAFLLQIDFNTATTDWANLAKEANAYRTNAFITVQG
ncbi:MAG TPA: alpha-xenorhabdolysin family binary toxin subunit A [Methylobacter sp.]